MKTDNGKVNPVCVGAEIGVRVVRLGEAEYRSVDTQKLTRVRNLLLDQAGKPSPPCLVVDLSAVRLLGASFIGILVDIWDLLLQRGRKLVLCGLTPSCRKLLLSLHLNKLFEMPPARHTAVER